MNDTKLDRNLRSIGKRIFVEYYSLFRDKDTSECVNTLFTEGVDRKIAGSRTRTYSAKQIFDNHCERKALEIVAGSAGVEPAIRKKAEDILKTGDVS